MSVVKLALVAFGLVISASSAIAQTKTECERSCVGISTSDGVMEVVVRDYNGGVLFFENRRSENLYAEENFEVVHLPELDVLGADLQKDGQSTTRVTNTPLPGGGVIIVVTVFAPDGSIISQTVMVVDQYGVLRDITQTV